MSVDPRLSARRRHVRASLAFGWLLAGIAVLALTPLDAWMPLVGWAPMLTLVVSPLLIVVAVDPGLPVRLVATGARGNRHLRASHPFA